MLTILENGIVVRCESNGIFNDGYTITSLATFSNVINPPVGPPPQ
jgi:hypothetical protein